MTRSSRHGSPEEGVALILRTAYERYRRGQRIDLARLAAEHGIGRATAYRWLGDNDRLLAKVVSKRIEENFAYLVSAHADKTGTEKILGVVDGFLRHAAGSERLHALLRHDRRRVLKVLATSTYGVQQLVVDLFTALLDTEKEAGYLDFAVPAHTLAHGIVRLIEGYLYADVVAGERRDIDTAVRLVGLLMPTQLRGDGRDRSRGTSIR